MVFMAIIACKEWNVKDLRDLLTPPSQRMEIVNDCVVLVEEEVKSKRGLAGAGVKAAFAVVKAIKPGIITYSINGLLDDFVAAIQPYYEGYQREGSEGTMESYLTPRAQEVAESLLNITDQRAERAGRVSAVVVLPARRRWACIRFVTLRTLVVSGRPTGGPCCRQGKSRPVWQGPADHRWPLPGGVRLLDVAQAVSPGD